MLWLCLRFHRLPLEALVRQKAAEPPEQLPLAVLEKQRVLQADDNAAELGIRPGMGTATVRALADRVTLLERDPEAEARCLQQLCCWAYSVSPTLYSFRQDCLLLEIGSCLSLHRGLDRLLQHIHTELSCRSYSYSQGLAPTPKAAWLLSHGDHPEACGERGADQHTGLSLEQQLAPLPLNLLEDFPRQVDALAKAGLWTFGDILALPRQALARRCGKEFLHYLQQVLGTAEDRQPEFLPPASFSDDYWFGYEVKVNEELQPAMQMLLQSLCRFLRNAQLQCQLIEWQLCGINRQVRRLQVRSSMPQAGWLEWYRLTGIQVEQLQLDTGVEGISLVCNELTPGNNQNLDLFDQARQKEPLHSLLDRLQNRLGLQAVEKIACRDEHLPEFAGYSCNSQHADPGPAPADAGLRPFWLMPSPQALRRSANHLYWNGRLTLLEGPERIEDNWWQEAVSRDYFIARDPEGHQYWVFRDRLHDHWYIQGMFA